MNYHRNRATKAKAAEVFAMKKYQAKRLMYKQPQLHINCNGELTAENCKAILLYTNTEIRLNMGKTISIKGDSLMMETMDKEVLTISGRLFSVEFCY